MPEPIRFLVRLEGEPRGPFALGRLRELADAGVITPQTEAAAQRAGPWAPLGEIAECAGLFPERRRFQFKTRDFEPVNRTETPPVDHRALIAAAHRGPVRPAGVRAAPPANDVLAIVQENTRRQLEHERPVNPSRAPGRRWRDYLLVMVAVNGFFTASLFLGGGSIFALSGMVLFSAGISWIMFGVMDRY